MTNQKHPDVALLTAHATGYSTAIPSTINMATMLMNSPAHSPAGEYDDEDSTMIADGQWQAQNPPGMSQTSPSMESSNLSGPQPPKVSMPMQKRRRVTRACDECRRKKIKCDGKQPCTHCTVYSYDCTFDQPSNRRRNPAPQYTEALEIRLQRAEALLKTVLPDVDLDDLNFDAGVPQRMHAPRYSSEQQASSAQSLSGASAGRPTQVIEVEKDSLLESMVQRTGSLDLDDQGHWDFHGHSSGLIFLRTMREQFGDLMGGTEGTGLPFQRNIRPMPLGLDSPKSSVDSPNDSNLPNTHDLPLKASGRELCENALDDACALMRFVHQPTFYQLFDRIFDTPPESFGNEENKFLPLLYLVMALGCLFAKGETNKLDNKGYEGAIDQGFIFFRAARQMMDVTDCRDLTSLQAIVFMILFLQSSAKLSTCYSYIGIAFRSALRMGLHRSIWTKSNLVERECRRRIFWVIRKMDTYVGAMLGLPKMVSDDDIDQELPLEIDDEFITAENITPMPSGQISLNAATNAHTRLVKILAKVVEYIYPIKSIEHIHSKSSQSYVVSYARIREIERDLREWMDNLPMALRPGGDSSPNWARVQQLLRMAYAHIQVMLYRPFLHNVSQSCQTKSVDKRSYACAATCVSVSRNIIHITTEMKKRGLLVGAYWFVMYTTFFSILGLIYFVLENPESPTSQDILRDANEGKEILASLAKRSMAADRCTVMLSGVFDQLPERLKRNRVNLLSSLSKKKRHAPSPLPAALTVSMRSTPDVIKQSQSDGELNGTMQRASTYPSQSSVPPWNRVSIPEEPLEPQAHTNQGLDTRYRQASFDAYTPSTSDHTGGKTPDSISSNGLTFSSAGPPNFSFQPTFGGSGFSDMSAMMFPSTDPFAYPTQPMTFVENRQTSKQESSYSPQSVKNAHMYATTPTSISTPYDSLEVQTFGPLPPYLMIGQQAMGMQAMGESMDISGIEPSGNMMSMSGDEAGWAQQQARTGGTPGVNLDEIFGEDWGGGWMEQGYRQQ